MDRQLPTWKALADRFWSAAAPDYREAAQLTAEIASAGDDALRQPQRQPSPSLRNALAPRADRSARDLAKRRFSLVRDRLHVLSAPRFGKRGVDILPFGRDLSAPEIQQAYKRAARTMHPDGGGSVREFVSLLAARDALMKERS